MVSSDPGVKSSFSKSSSRLSKLSSAGDSCSCWESGSLSVGDCSSFWAVDSNVFREGVLAATVSFVEILACACSVSCGLTKNFCSHLAHLNSTPSGLISGKSTW